MRRIISYIFFDSCRFFRYNKSNATQTLCGIAIKNGEIMQTFPKKRGILAVFLSDLQSEYNHTVLEGITKQANALHYDMVTFSFFSNTNRDTPFQIGEENILSLFHKGYADGILRQKGMFQKPEVR